MAKQHVKQHPLQRMLGKPGITGEVLAAVFRYQSALGINRPGRQDVLAGMIELSKPGMPTKVSGGDRSTPQDREIRNLEVLDQIRFVNDHIDQTVGKEFREIFVFWMAGLTNPEKYSQCTDNSNGYSADTIRRRMLDVAKAIEEGYRLPLPLKGHSQVMDCPPSLYSRYTVYGKADKEQHGNGHVEDTEYSKQWLSQGFTQKAKQERKLSGVSS